MAIVIACLALIVCGCCLLAWGLFGPNGAQYLYAQGFCIVMGGLLLIAGLAASAIVSIAYLLGRAV